MVLPAPPETARLAVQEATPLVVDRPALPLRYVFAIFSDHCCSSFANEPQSSLAAELRAHRAAVAKKAAAQQQAAAQALPQHPAAAPLPLRPVLHRRTMPLLRASSVLLVLPPSLSCKPLPHAEGARKATLFAFRTTLIYV